MRWGSREHRQPTAMSVVSPIAAASIGALALLSLSATSGRCEAGSALEQRGLALSKLHCARCHIVDESDRFTGTSSTPSFKIMIEFLNDWEERFVSFMARNPHPAHIRLDGDDPRPEHLPATIREMILSLDDIEAILAYVNQMAVELGKKPPED
ncbi:hypothetical protein [Labrenzia sp. CE80]|uniref:hypothetical protein n=1 Tax=Labrenzia sp. CE80 TaxID=1788986 RepID=UPI00129A39CA|nr:hypothetical protein [Labrenzia sp. CE80]